MPALLMSLPRAANQEECLAPISVEIIHVICNTEPAPSHQGNEKTLAGPFKTAGSVE